MNKYIIFLIVAIPCLEARRGCPFFPDVLRDSASQLISDAEEILDIIPYDTKDMKFYVMTPSSYPNFENPEGKPVNWANLDCKDKPVLVNCHGFREFGFQLWAVDLIRTFIEQFGGCAVSTDYVGATENLNYFTVAFANTGNIAQVVTDYVAENICPGINCTEQLQLHGHSWGAHICGIAGYKLGQRHKNFKPARVMASDAAGPYFNVLSPNPSLHLSPESGRTVINIKTSRIAGSSKKEWAHQTQYIGDCGTRQKQCPISLDLIEDAICDHEASIFVTKSTMIKTYPLVNVTKCASCKNILTMLEFCTDEHDYLGWQSTGKPGLFVIKDLPVCLNTTVNGAVDYYQPL